MKTVQRVVYLCWQDDQPALSWLKNCFQWLAPQLSVERLPNCGWGQCPTERSEPRKSKLGHKGHPPWYPSQDWYCQATLEGTPWPPHRARCSRQYLDLKTKMNLHTLAAFMKYKGIFKQSSEFVVSHQLPQCAGQIAFSIFYCQK